MKRALNASMMFSCNIYQLAQRTIVQTTYKTKTHINRNNLLMKFHVSSLVESGHVDRIGQVLLNART